MALLQTLVIRGMKPADVATVAELAGQLGYPTSAGDLQRRYELIKDRRDARLLGAQRGDEHLVGWLHVQAVYMLESEPRAAIWGLIVSEQARGSGVGRALVEAAEAWALQRGLTQMAVNSNVIRTEAKGFYERLGYAVTKTQNAFRKVLQ